MNRSVSPIHLHVNRKAPVHVHVGGTSPAPCGRAASMSSSGRRMRARDWVRAGSSKGPWLPPPAKCSKNRMTWEGPTHRLEINPVENGDGTRLRLSDLGQSGATDIILNGEEEASSPPRINSLTAEVNTLKEEINLHRSLRELEEAQAELRASRLSLREREVELEDAVQRHGLACSKHCSICREGSQAISIHREALLGKMGEVEVDSGAVVRHSENLRGVLRRLIRDKNLSVSRAREATDHSRLLQERLCDLDSSTRSLKQLLKAQQKYERKACHLDDQRESLLRRVVDSEAKTEVLRARLADRDKLAMHSQELHDKLSLKETEAQTLSIQAQSLEDSLHHKELECARMETSLLETKRKAQADKDALKKATHNHRERAMKNEASAGALAQQVEELSTTLELLKSKSLRDKVQADTEIRHLTTQVGDLQQSLDRSQRAGHSHQSALDATNARLSDKNHEISSLQIENEKLKVNVSSLEGQLKTFQCTCQCRLVTAQTEVTELQGTIGQYESLLSDYRTQLEQSHAECEELTTEMRKKEQELDELQRASMMEQERMKLRFQQQISELEGYPHELKTTQGRMQETQERLRIYEQRNSDQIKLLAELTTKVEQQSAMADALKTQLHGSVTECKTNAVRLETSEKRLQEVDQQNHELVALISKKEETIQRLQARTEEFIREKAALSSQLDSLRADSRHQTEELRARATAREKMEHARISELQAQLSRSTATASQLRRSKEEMERKLHMRIHDLQERLEQSQATKKSLENYVTFLKSSYASIFSDSPSAHHSPLLH